MEYRLLHYHPPYIHHERWITGAPSTYIVRRSISLGPSPALISMNLSAVGSHHPRGQIHDPCVGLTFGECQRRSLCQTSGSSHSVAQWIALSANWLTALRRGIREECLQCAAPSHFECLATRALRHPRRYACLPHRKVRATCESCDDDVSLPAWCTLHITSVGDADISSRDELRFLTALLPFGYSAQAQ